MRINGPLSCSFARWTRAEAWEDGRARVDPPAVLDVWKERSSERLDVSGELTPKKAGLGNRFI